MNSRKILVGVSGGIAAYKALDVISALRKQGHFVQVVLTDAATKFVQPITFSSVSGHPVLHEMWPKEAQTLEEGYPHLYPATEVDLFLLIPATANTIAKLAGGFGSDLLSTCCLSLPGTCAKIFCPSMNKEMWQNSTVKQNARTLVNAGWTQIGPDSGHLACGMTGEGRLSGMEEILQVVKDKLEDAKRLSGQTLLILSGPTREHLDPVRFIGNPSSGRMGQALAEEAAHLGAKVQFVTGPVPDDHLPRNQNIKIHSVMGALEMMDAARTYLQEADAVIYVAAVSDYRPEEMLQEKMPKQDAEFQLKLIPNPDISATLNAEKAANTFTIGFALQTDRGEPQARKKLSAKGLDGIVLNYSDSMGAATGHFSYLGSDKKDFEVWGGINKTDAARKILAKLPHPL